MSLQMKLGAWQNISLLAICFIVLWICFSIYLYNFSVFFPTFIVTNTHTGFNMVVVWNYDQSFLVEVLLMPLMTIRNCYQQRYLCCVISVVMNSFTDWPVEFFCFHSYAPYWFEVCEEFSTNIFFILLFHFPLRTKICIMDKFIVRHISPIIASIENESNGPEKRKPNIVCQLYSDIYLVFAFFWWCFLIASHVEINLVTVLWFQASWSDIL
jgi:hypothetical protein